MFARYPPELVKPHSQQSTEGKIATRLLEFLSRDDAPRSGIAAVDIGSLLVQEIVHLLVAEIAVVIQTGFAVYNVLVYLFVRGEDVVWVVWGQGGAAGEEAVGLAVGLQAEGCLEDQVVFKAVEGDCFCVWVGVGVHYVLEGFYMRHLFRWIGVYWVGGVVGVLYFK